MEPRVLVIARSVPRGAVVRAISGGRPVSDEPPFGATVMVFRWQSAGPRGLLIHAHHGPSYAGGWAWTPPAGARLPG